MQELELTMQRVLSIWWLLLWRWGIGGFIVGFIAGAVAGFLVTVLGHKELAVAAGGYAGLALSPFWGLLVVHMALKKKYSTFRLALVPVQNSN